SLPPLSGGGGANPASTTRIVPLLAFPPAAAVPYNLPSLAWMRAAPTPMPAKDDRKVDCTKAPFRVLVNIAPPWPPPERQVVPQRLPSDACTRVLGFFPSVPLLKGRIC